MSITIALAKANPISMAGVSKRTLKLPDKRAVRRVCFRTAGGTGTTCRSSYQWIAAAGELAYVAPTAMQEMVTRMADIGLGWAGAVLSVGLCRGTRDIHDYTTHARTNTRTRKENKRQENLSQSQQHDVETDKFGDGKCGSQVHGKPNYHKI